MSAAHCPRSPPVLPSGRMTHIIRSRKVGAGVVTALIALPVGALSGNSLVGQTPAVHADGGSDEAPVTTTSPVDEGAAPSNKVIPITEETRRALDGVSGTKIPESMRACLPDVPEGYMIRGADLFSGKDCHSKQRQSRHEIGDAPPPDGLVEVCRADLSADPSCGVALAMADGALEAGTYTDQALQDAVAAAGYSWAPAR